MKNKKGKKEMTNKIINVEEQKGEQETWNKK